MNNETIKFTSSHVIILSEENSSDSVDAKFIICDFQPNGNDVSLNRDTIEEWLKTLINKPVVGKVVTRFDGKDDFSGHNVKVVEETDVDGNTIKTVEFDTNAFGSFYNVQIETVDDVEYITASAKIWKRFKKAYNVFKKRVESKKGLKTSWEISVHESHKEKIKNKNIKVIDYGEFIGHCLLGETIAPAYKSSGVIDVASEDHDTELVQALSQDIITLSSIEYESNENKEGGEFEVADKKDDTKQTSALTENDVYRKVRQAINNTSTDKYYYMSMLYPYEFKAIAYDWNREKDSDFVEFSYSVNSDDTVSIISKKEVEMVFQPKSSIDSQVSNLQTKLEESEKQIAEAGKLLTEAKKEKEGLEAQVSELLSYKDKVVEMEQAEKERELAEKKDTLKTFALEDSLISEEELKTDDKLVQIFAELTLDNFETSQEKIEVIKGRKAIAMFKENKELSNKENNEVETSQVETLKRPKTDLNGSGNDGLMVSATDLIKSVLTKNK
ncbi:hypothetical protein GCM10023310_70990 [Paenibacillus vulneris]|uniref:Prophage tail endopeptidase domain-containing protein n=1 Tax=Paenibacillus vulneris TaxID=1133364 RepID=A0ABW3UIX9_9BACL